MKPCPYCGEPIQDVAVKCRYCGEWLDPSKRPDAARAPQPAAHEAPSAPPLPVEAPRMLGARTELSVSTGSSDMSFSAGTIGAARLGPPPAWDPPPESLSAATIRGVPPKTIEPGLGHQQHIPTLLPEAEKRAPERAHVPAPMSVAQIPPLVASPLPPPPVPAPSVPQPVPPPPPALEVPLTIEPEPAPPAPAGAFQARPADEFMKAFLGAAEPADAGGAADDDPFGASMAAPAPPPPWPWIGAIGATVAIVALYVFRGALFGAAEAPPDPAATEAKADVKAEPAPEAKVEPAPEAKVEPAPEAKAAEVKPDTKAAPETKAAPPTTPTPPAPTDPAFAEQLAKAKAAYAAGKLKVTAAVLSDLSKQAPEHPEVLLLTAQVQLEEGKLPESQATADKCVALDPNLADCWLTLGVLRQNNKDAVGAAAAYETYLKLAPTGRHARAATSQLARLKKASG